MKKESKSKKTIKILEHSKCTGCGACYNKCPVDAITMVADDEGFLCPKIDTAKCTLCGQCEKTCPELHPVALGNENPECYAVMAKDEIRWVTSSGGAFVLCADWIFEQGGYVCGAEFTEDFRGVRTVMIDSWEQLPKLMRSKYVQSDTNTIYRQIKDKLDTTDKPVLFCGCPCQVAGLYNYLGKEYEKLYTLDLVCHGVPSPKAYKQYLEEVSNGRKISNVNFRPKDKGWTTPVEIHFNNGQRYYEDWKGKYYTIFLGGFGCREACHACQYAKVPRVGNITLGDFWGVQEQNPNWNDHKGTSIVVVNDNKGSQLLAAIKEKTTLFEKADLEQAKKHNGNLRVPMRISPNRDIFFSHLDSHGFSKAYRYAKAELMDVGIVGWWYGPNYGSAMTYFALYQVLRSMHLQVRMITHPERKEYYDEEHNTIKFANKHYRSTLHRGYDRLCELNEYFDAFVLGADQLWNYATGYTHYHMLSFAESTKKKIAFSTSFGHNKLYFPQKTFEEAKFYMQRLDAVSVREKDGIALADKYFNVKADYVPDPVFICERASYDKITEDAVNKSEPGFLFAYILDPTEEKKNAIKSVASKLGLRIVSIVDRQTDRRKKEDSMSDMGIIRDASVENWVYHFKNAAFVITDSFHGTCFSIIYEKTFITIGNAYRGNSRFETVLGEFGLMNRFVTSAGEIIGNDTLLSGVDFKPVSKFIKKERKRGINWLKNALECDKSANLSEYDILLRKYDAMIKRIVELEGKVGKNQNGGSK